MPDPRRPDQVYTPGDCCDPGLHGREPVPETRCDANTLSILVVVHFPESDRTGEPTAFGYA
jgi:hypothetical protein